MSDIGIRGPTPSTSPEFYHRSSEKPTLASMQYSVLTALAEVQKETLASTRPTQEAIQYGVLASLAKVENALLQPLERPVVAIKYAVLTELAQTEQAIAKPQVTQAASQYGVLLGMANALSSVTGKVS